VLYSKWKYSTPKIVLIRPCQPVGRIGEARRISEAQIGIKGAPVIRECAQGEDGELLRRLIHERFGDSLAAVAWQHIDMTDSADDGAVQVGIGVDIADRDQMLLVISAEQERSIFAKGDFAGGVLIPQSLYKGITLAERLKER